MNEPFWSAVVVLRTLFSIVSIVIRSLILAGVILASFHACAVQFSLNLFDSEQEHVDEFCL